MKIILQGLILIAIIILPLDGFSQGCVAIRGGGACGGNALGGNGFIMKGDFMAGTGVRYFKSFRHFRGSHEETNRVADGTEVINHSTFLDFSITYGISDRTYGTLVLPFVFHNRSSMYEHGGNPPNGLGERHTTTASGLADVRMEVGYWLIDPARQKKFNYAVGLGMKLPTGKYDYTDLFYNQGPDRNIDETAVVDQSIQPGDGGLAATLNIQGFHTLSPKWIINTNIYYLFNFQATNGVATRNGRSEFSCPDQFAIRAGGIYVTGIPGLSLYGGLRAEGVPSNDLIGSSEGYRRPGYVYSVEPGINFATNKIGLNLSVPFALYRNRIQSYEDKIRTETTGNYSHGDAAFADHLINFSFTYRIGKKNGSHILDNTEKQQLEL